MENLNSCGEIPNQQKRLNEINSQHNLERTTTKHTLFLLLSLSRHHQETPVFHFTPVGSVHSNHSLLSTVFPSRSPFSLIATTHKSLLFFLPIVEMCSHLFFS
ncbi:hypothetical protein L1887_03630 [Cichorium endivia]|nr:hypothetical protein L1887_03630 [Cichorium endivia]